jgi:hypothetical protein
MNEIENMRQQFEEQGGIEKHDINSITITSHADFETVGAIIVQNAAQKKKIEEWFKPLKASRHAAWKAVCDEENFWLKLIEDENTQARTKANAWVKRCEEIEAQENKEAQHEAFELVKKFKDTFDHKQPVTPQYEAFVQSASLIDKTGWSNNKQYQFNEQVKNALEALKMWVAYKVAEVKKAELEANAVLAIQSGNDEQAQNLFDSAQNVEPVIEEPSIALPVVAPVKAPEPMKVAGTRTREYWTAVIENPELVPAYIDGMGVKVCIRTIDESKLKEIAKQTEGKAVIPGVKFVKETRVEVTGR